MNDETENFDWHQVAETIISHFSENNHKNKLKLAELLEKSHNISVSRGIQAANSRIKIWREESRDVDKLIAELDYLSHLVEKE